VFFPGVWVCLRDFILFIFIFAALSGSLHFGKTLGPEKSFRNTAGKPGPLRRGKRKHL